MSIRVVELVAAGLVLAAIAGGQSTPTDRADLNKQREYWNDKFRSGLPNVRREPSRVLVDALSEQTLRPGSALDLGCGEGRNLLYLTERGWTVTGVDLSEVAVGQAKQAVAAKKLRANFVVAGLDEFDLGENQWDLIRSIYMQDWHLKSQDEHVSPDEKSPQARGPGNH
ncbi:MAG: class I SAM-dependent methyltransferase [Bryobacterales bacterium]|nr:class I SAM-dependent methyltransferase [Bryobacterales bacterium]